MSMYKVINHPNHESVEVRNNNDDCVGIILGADTYVMEAWDAVEAGLPESFGPVLAEHLLSWAKQCGLVVLEPRPHWITRITGSFNVNDGEQVAEHLSRMDKY